MLGKLLIMYKSMLQGKVLDKTMQNFNEEMLASIPSFFYANMEKKYRPEIGVRLDGLVLSCKYKGIPCDENDFKHYLHPILFNCYTFQANSPKFDGNTNLLRGHQYGLSLILRSEATGNLWYNRIDNNANINSVRVSIHPPDTIPFVMDKGINLEPGKSTAISLMMKTVKRLGLPYTKCQEQEWFTVRGRQFLKTSDVCREQCIVKSIEEKCHCTSINFEDLLCRDDQEYCYTFHEGMTLEMLFARSMCEREVVQHMSNMKCAECIWDCYETDYNTQIAFADWPHGNTIQNFIETYIDPLPCTNAIKQYYESLKQATGTGNDSCKQTPVNDTRLPFSLMTMSNLLSDSNNDTNVIMSLASNDFTSAFRYQGDFPKEYYETTFNNIDDLNAKWVKDSFYRLNIYFSKSTVEQHNQVVSFILADLWSSVWGILWLF